MESREVTSLKRQLSAKEKQIDKHKKEVDTSYKQVEVHKHKTEELRKERRALRKHLKRHADVYILEMRKALSTAILAAFAFLMALSWREYISEAVSSVVSLNPAQGKLISAIVVTLISVIGIIVATRLLAVKEK